MGTELRCYGGTPITCKPGTQRQFAAGTGKALYIFLREHQLDPVPVYLVIGLQGLVPVLEKALLDRKSIV